MFLRNNKIIALSDAARTVNPVPFIFRSDKARNPILKHCKFNKPQTTYLLPNMRKIYSIMSDGVIGAATRPRGG